MYSLIGVDGKENKKRKGVNCVVVKNIRHKEYLNLLINKKNNETQNEKNLE